MSRASLNALAAPGDFSGQLLDGSVQRLRSYGIFDFDLRNLKGQSLKLRQGASILLSIAVPPRTCKAGSQASRLL